MIYPYRQAHAEKYALAALRCIKGQSLLLVKCQIRIEESSSVPLEQAAHRVLVLQQDSSGPGQFLLEHPRSLVVYGAPEIVAQVERILNAHQVPLGPNLHQYALGKNVRGSGV